MKHTPEPWEVTTDGQGFPHVVTRREAPDSVTRARFAFLLQTCRLPPVLYSAGQGGEKTRETGGAAERKANADRVVACVNAMRGIEDPAALVRAAREVLIDLDNLTTEEFRAGCDQTSRENLRRALGEE